MILEPAPADIDFATQATVGFTRPRRVPPAYPDRLIEQAYLDDGTPVTIRPIHADDMALEVAFIRGLSRRSQYQRMLSGRKLRTDELRRLVEIDYGREMALIATVWLDGFEKQIGVARYVPEGDGLSCEIAIVVADGFHGRGLGEKLLQSLVRSAIDAGVPELTGLTLSTNLAMLGLARKLGFELHRDRFDATVTLLRKRLHAAAETPAQGQPS